MIHFRSTSEPVLPAEQEHWLAQAGLAVDRGSSQALPLHSIDDDARIQRTGVVDDVVLIGSIGSARQNLAVLFGATLVGAARSEDVLTTRLHLDFERHSVAAVSIRKRDALLALSATLVALVLRIAGAVLRLCNRVRRALIAVRVDQDDAFLRGRSQSEQQQTHRYNT